MRIICSVCVVDRQLGQQPLGISQQKLKPKYLKSTLALCKQPKSDTDFCIILFTSTNKTGTKYNVRGNIRQILTRFINEGKATVQFNVPPHDLNVQADSTHLKQYLILLKKMLQNKVTSEDVKYSSISVTALNHNIVAPKKLAIKVRGDYPVHGFPSTLEILQINDVRRLSFDIGILKLKNLRVLDLSHNLIETLPEALNSLDHLTELNMSTNMMNRSLVRDWDWMGGKLSKTLKSLNLCANQLLYVPQQLLKLHNLVTLHLDKNLIKHLPSGIGNLRNLRILTLSSNYVATFPGSFKNLRLDELDVCTNRWVNAEGNQAQNNFAAQFPKPLSLQSLRNHAARAVLLARIVYDREMLPLTLINFLDTAQYCVCGNACFDVFILHRDVLWLENVTKELRVSRGAGAFVPIDVFFCSMRCYASTHRRRTLVR